LDFLDLDIIEIEMGTRMLTTPRKWGGNEGISFWSTGVIAG